VDPDTKPSMLKTSIVAASVGVKGNGVCSHGVAYDSKYSLIGSSKVICCPLAIGHQLIFDCSYRPPPALGGSRRKPLQMSLSSTIVARMARRRNVLFLFSFYILSFSWSAILSSYAFLFD
jgi:hypothetical protein